MADTTEAVILLLLDSFDLVALQQKAVPQSSSFYAVRLVYQLDVVELASRNDTGSIC